MIYTKTHYVCDICSRELETIRNYRECRLCRVTEFDAGCFDIYAKKKKILICNKCFAEIKAKVTRKTEEEETV